MKNLKLVVVSLGLLGTAACAQRINLTGGADAPGAPGAAGTATPLPPLPTREVAASRSVAADGALGLSVPPVPVTFETQGKVLKVNVQPGQKVKIGDLLAELDDQALKDAAALAREALALQEAQIKQANAPKTAQAGELDSAKAALASSQSRLNEVKRGATFSDINSARAALESAQARYAEVIKPTAASDLASAEANVLVVQKRLENARSGASPADLEQSLRSWNQAKNSLYGSQISRDAQCGNGRESSAQCKSSEATVGQSFESERAAAARYETLKTPTEAGIRAAESDLAVAQKRVDDLKIGATQDRIKSANAEVQSAQARLNALYLQNSSDKQTQAFAEVASAESRLKQLTDPAPLTAETKAVQAVQLANAKASVERAERNLVKAKLLAPCDCTVQDVNVSVGANATGAAMTLVDTRQVVFRTSNLSELNLGQIKVANVASVRLKPYDKTFAGKVSAILPSSSGVQGTSALFTVIIALDPATEDFLPGMTGQAEIAVSK